MNKIIGLVLALVIGATLVGGLLVPTVQAVTTTETTFENKDYFITMDKITADDAEAHTISWAKADPYKIIVDEEEITPTWESVTIFAEEDNLLRCTKSSAGYYLNFVGATQPTGYGNINDQSMTVTIESGTITFSGLTQSNTTYTTSSTFDTAYIINPDNEGEYNFIMKTPAAKAYVKGDSEIYGIGFSVVGGVWQNIFSISGTIDDGLIVELISTTLDTEPTISNQTTVYNAVEGYKSLYQFEKETFTANYDGTDTNLTYSYVIVPAEVTAEKSQHLDASQIAMFGVIGLLGIVLLVTIAASAVRSKY